MQDGVVDVNPIPRNDVTLTDQSSTLVNPVKTWQIELPMIEKKTSKLENSKICNFQSNQFLIIKVSL